MGIDPNQIVVKDNAAERRYEARVDGELAVVEYEIEHQPDGDRIVFIHTEVPEALEGHGIAGQLARAALEDARARHLTVVPLCPFVTTYIRRHQEYVLLVDPAYRHRVERGEHAPGEQAPQ
jgi:predicted GNAT family acetyltransferase